MKNIKYILSALVATFALSGCSDDPTYTSGEVENDKSYGVYFPTQANATDLELDPTDPTALKFEVKRAKSEGEITVPINITSPTEGIFKATPVKFADGQETAEFTINFPTAEIGTTYKCNISVTDPNYVFVYGDKSVGFDFSITRVKWNQVKAGSEELAIWTDAIVGPIFGVAPTAGKCKVYERDDRKGYYRFENPYNNDLVDAMFGKGAGEAWGNEANIIIDATNANKVWIPRQEIGLAVNKGSDTDFGAISFASYVTEIFPKVDAPIYGNLVDGVIRFPKEAIMAAMANYKGGAFGYLMNDIEMVILLPGAKVYDYKLALSAAEPKEGKVAISAQLGVDITKVKYAFFEGALKAGDVATNSVGINAGDIKSVEITKTGTIEAQFEKTGKYTIVANIYNVKGELEGYKSLTFGYITAGEEVPVVVSVGLDITDKYKPEGFTSEDSAEFYAYGENIEWAYFGVFETASLTADTDLAELVTTAGKALKAEDLAKLNDKGYAVVVGDLVGGTEYTAILLANNGYVSAVKTATATTNGTPHPLKRKYTLNDLNEIEKPALFKSWNLWAVDIFDKKNSKRQKLGTITFAENTKDDVEDPDPNESVDAIDVTGLTLGAVAEDHATWEYSGGIVAAGAPENLGNFNYEGQTLYLQNLYLDSSLGKAFVANWALIGGVVAEGYMAFVGNPAYVEQGVNFDGILLVAYTDKELTAKAGNWEAYSNIMCEDPAVATPTTTAKLTLKQLQDVGREVFTEPTNLVELRGRERLRALIKEQVGKQKSVNRATTLVPVEMPSRGVAKATTTFREGIEQPVFGNVVVRKSTQRVVVE